MSAGWFVKGTEPRAVCDRHILCKVAGADGGVLHGGEEMTAAGRTVALIRVERRFPIPVTVSDAQYVYGGDPAVLARNTDASRAYFDLSPEQLCGRSDTARPFNRSAPPPEMITDGTEETERSEEQEGISPEWWRSIFPHPRIG